MGIDRSRRAHGQASPTSAPGDCVSEGFSGLGPAHRRPDSHAAYCALRDLGIRAIVEPDQERGNRRPMKKSYF